MFDTFLEVLSKGVISITDIFLSPVNILVNNLFPNMSDMIVAFNSFVSNYVGSTIAYFSSIIPPMTRSCIAFWISFLIIYYGVAWSYTLIVKIANVIQKIKFW